MMIKENKRAALLALGCFFFSSPCFTAEGTFPQAYENAQAMRDDHLKKALSSLDIAIFLSQSIDASAPFISCKQNIEVAILRRDYKSAYDACECLYENMDEILAEFPNQETKMKISANMCAMMKELRLLKRSEFDRR